MLGKQPRDTYTNTKEVSKCQKQWFWEINVSNKGKKLLVVMFPYKQKEKQADTAMIIQ